MGFGRPLGSSTRYENRGFGTGVGTTVTASVTAGSKGTAANLGAVTSFDYDGIIVSYSHGNSVRYRLDILANNGGADEKIVEDLLIDGSSSGAYIGSSIFVPVSVRSGAQLKGQLASSNGGNTLTVGISGFQGDARQLAGFRALKSFTDWDATTPINPVSGKNQAALTGTTLTGWNEIIASSPCRCAGLYATIDTMGNVPASAGVLFTVGWGAAGSERALFTIPYSNGGATSGTSPAVGPFPCDFPAGTRFAWQGQASGADTATMAMVLNGLAA